LRPLEPTVSARFGFLTAAPLFISYKLLFTDCEAIPRGGPEQVGERLGRQWITISSPGSPITVSDGSTFTLQELEGINGTICETLAPGATLASAGPSGGVEIASVLS